jgi:short-subunit dehydrogenase involved in D-alanine esterification of teichoic acids
VSPGRRGRNAPGRGRGGTGSGNKVIVAGRREEQLRRITAGHPGIEAVVIDPADPASVAKAADTVRTRFPETNVLITMAGRDSADWARWG